MMKKDFVCPKCRGALVPLDGGVKKCAAGHSYDRARAGYYNLLLGSSGGDHGDNKMMVEARRAFLAGGYYSPLAERVAALVAEHALTTVEQGKPATQPDQTISSDKSSAPSNKSTTPSEGRLTPSGAVGREAYIPTVLDCGCGEGYYTARVCSVLDGALGADGYSMLTFDISRDAAKLAARAARSASVAVASCYSIPVADGSVDIAMNVFSPLAPDEIHRALHQSGVYIVAYPGEDHLYDLKAAIYDNPYKNQPQGRAPDGFSLKSRERVAYEIDLGTNAEITALFSMTPYAYRTGKKERERLEKIEKLRTRVEFFIDIYEKQG